MSPPEARDPTDPAEWLRRAKSNLAIAKASEGAEDVVLEDLCFEAQQAAEKALKALLVHLQIAFPKTHSIVELLTVIEGAGVTFPEEIREAAILSEYAVGARYPGFEEDVAESEYEEAIDLAERVLRWVESRVAETIP